MKIFKSIILLMLLACLAFSAPIFPQLNNSRVIDDAGIFDANQEMALDKKLANHETNTSNQIVVVTIKSLDGYDISDYGYQLGRHWGIGQKDKNNGVLLIVAPNERKVRIEVGYGLEGALPDATSKTIIQNDILPFFKKGNYYDGVNSGIDKILSAIKGEYTPAKSTNESSSIGFILFPILFIVIVFINAMPKGEDRKKRIIPAIIVSSVAGFISWMMFFVLGVSIFIAVIVFLATMFGSNSNLSDGNYHSTGGGFGGSDFGSSDFGGFSSGGGSFGGGGASGDW